MYNFIKKSKTWFTKSHYSGRLAMVFGIVLVGVFVVANPVSAQVGDWIIGVASGAVQIVVDNIVDLYLYVVGSLLTSILIPVLVGIAQYNGFINNPIVSTGWALTRDLANVFFIIVLLVIAFSTMLRLQTYHYKQALSKLILMIVLVNFSKVISGILIDFFQVLMLTFVNGFKSAMGGNFISAFHIYDMLSFAQTSASIAGTDAAASSADWQITGALVLAAVGITVVTMTVLIMIAVLLYRMVMIWILVVLSPLAYFAYTIRPKYWSQWWSEFFKNLVSGPAIAFFLWLALLTAQTGQVFNLGAGIDINKGTEEGTTLGIAFAMPSVMMNFMAMTTLMIAGLVVSQKIAAQSGAVVGNFANKVRGAGIKAMKFGTGAFVAKGAYDWGANRVKAVQSMRKNIKQEKVHKFAAGAMNKYGAVKQNTVGLAGKAVKHGLDAITGQKTLDARNKKVSALEFDIAQDTSKGINTDAKKAQLEELKPSFLLKNWNRLTKKGVGNVTGLNHLTNLAAESGVAERQQTRNFKSQEVGKFTNEMNSLTGQQAFDIHNNATEPKYRRIAAGKRAIESGHVNADQVDMIRETIKDLSGNDEVLTQGLESSIDKFAPTVSKSKVPKDFDSKYQWLLEKGLETGKEADIDRTSDVMSILQAHSADKSGANIQASKFDINFVSKLSTASRGNFAENLVETAKKTEDADIRRGALEALSMMGEVNEITKTGGVAADLEAQHKADPAKGLAAAEINSIIRGAVRESPEVFTKNTVQHAKDIDPKTFDRLNAKGTNGERILKTSSHSELVGKLMNKRAPGAALGTTNGDVIWQDSIPSVTDNSSRLTTAALDDRAVASAKVTAHTGRMKGIGNVKTGDSTKNKEFKIKFVKQLSKNFKPSVMAKTNFADADKGTMLLIVKKIVSEFTAGNFKSQTLVQADHSVAANNGDSKNIDALLAGLGKEAKTNKEAERLIKELEKAPFSNTAARTGF